MKKRWFIYIIVGILFGIFDCYYQEYTEGISSSSMISWFIVAWGIWLIPIIPIVLYEAKATSSKLKSTLASITTWSISIISYYLFIAVKLIFIGQKTRPEVYIKNRSDPYYWSNMKGLFLGDALSGFVEWIGVAIIGGGVVGFLGSFIYLRFKKSNDEQSL